jgi:hypothetical protein
MRCPPNRVNSTLVWWRSVCVFGVLGRARIGSSALARRFENAIGRADDLASLSTHLVFKHHRLHPLNLPISHASSARVRRASQAAGKVARRQPGARCFA